MRRVTSDPGPPELPPGAFARIDDGDDLTFYAQPRLVTHIDDAAIRALTDCYRRLLPQGGDLLDLMSSWVSHLPAEVGYGRVVGHGMNADELAANPRLTERFVRDLNRDPALPLASAGLDAAMICMGVQYLRQPLAVLKDVARVLRPGAPLAISFSNRCFPTKAVAIWRALDGVGHARLVEYYLGRAGFGDIEIRGLDEGRRGDPLTVVVGRAP